MALGGFVLGGALKGIGAGIAEQGKANAEASARVAEQDAIMRREIALENLRSTNRQAEATHGSGLKREEVVAGARVDDWKDARKTGRSTDSTIKIEGVKADNQIKVEQVKAANDRTIEQIKSRNRINETQAAELAQLSADAARAGFEIHDVVTTADGRLAAVTKDGRRMTLSGTAGQFNDRNAPEDLGLGSFPGAARPALPAAPQKPTVSNW